MSRVIPPLPQDAFMAWCLGKAQGQLYLFTLPLCLASKCRLNVYPLSTFTLRLHITPMTLPLFWTKQYFSVHCSRHTVFFFFFFFQLPLLRFTFVNHGFYLGNERLHTKHTPLTITESQLSSAECNKRFPWTFLNHKRHDINESYSQDHSTKSQLTAWLQTAERRLWKLSCSLGWQRKQTILNAEHCDWRQWFTLFETPTVGSLLAKT
jgi:hypothetical protein